MKRDSFIMYRSFYEPVKGLSNEDKGVLFDAIYNYALDEIEPENLSPTNQMAFSFISSTIDRDSKKYQNIIERNRENIGKRWNKKGAKNTTGKTGKISYSDNDTATDNLNDNVDENTKKVLSEKFEIFRKQYPGTKGGFNLEFKNFIKKSQSGDIDLLIPALEREKTYKAKLKELNSFCSEWKNLSTWINKKCWSQELPEIESKVNSPERTNKVYDPNNYKPKINTPAEWLK